MSITIPTSFTDNTPAGRKREQFGFVARWTTRMRAKELSEAEITACAEATWKLSRLNAAERAREEADRRTAETGRR